MSCLDFSTVVAFVRSRIDPSNSPRDSHRFLIAVSDTPSLRATNALDSRSSIRTSMSSEGHVILYTVSGLSAAPCVRMPFRSNRDFSAPTVTSRSSATCFIPLTSHIRLSSSLDGHTSLDAFPLWKITSSRVASAKPSRAHISRTRVICVVTTCRPLALTTSARSGSLRAFSRANRCASLTSPSVKGSLRLAFLPAKVGVSAWQLGHKNLKFRRLLLSLSPSIWSICRGAGTPLHSVIPHSAHLRGTPQFNINCRKRFALDAI